MGCGSCNFRLSDKVSISGFGSLPERHTHDGRGGWRGWIPGLLPTLAEDLLVFHDKTNPEILELLVIRF